MFKSIQEARQFIQENGIQMVDFKLTDLDGRWRHLTIPAERLDEGIMEHGIGFDGSNYGYAMVDNSDMVFIRTWPPALWTPMCRSLPCPLWGM